MVREKMEVFSPIPARLTGRPSSRLHTKVDLDLRSSSPVMQRSAWVLPLPGHRVLTLCCRLREGSKLKLWTTYLRGVCTSLCTTGDSDLGLQLTAGTSHSSDIPSARGWFRSDCQIGYEESFGRPYQVLSISDSPTPVSTTRSLKRTKGAPAPAPKK